MIYTSVQLLFYFLCFLFLFLEIKKRLSSGLRNQISINLSLYIFASEMHILIVFTYGVSFYLHYDVDSEKLNLDVQEKRNLIAYNMEFMGVNMQDSHVVVCKKRTMKELP